MSTKNTLAKSIIKKKNRIGNSSKKTDSEAEEVKADAEAEEPRYNLRERPPPKIPLSLQQINDRIQAEVCRDTLAKLSDSAMLEEYKASKSMKKNISKLKTVLIKNGITEDKIANIITDYTSSLIAPAVKGTLRGRKFNLIVQEVVLKIAKNLHLNNDKFEIKFEKKCKALETSEIPDWYIWEKKTDKVIIGMNQLDLWGGGQQSNRGSKYVTESTQNTQKGKLLCVVCNEVKIDTVNNKTYKLFNAGFTNDTLCYVKNIETIVKKFFDL